jgi:hypothetical protein
MRPVEKIGRTTEAMAELRKLFPKAKIELTFGETEQGSRYVRIRTDCTERYTSVIVRATLGEALAAKRVEAIAE